MLRLLTFCSLVWLFCFDLSFALSFKGIEVQSPPGNPTDQLLNDVIYPPTIRGRPAFRTAGGKWPNNEIPYEITGFTRSQEEFIKETIEEFHNFTCFRWIPKRPEDKAFATFILTSIVPGTNWCGSSVLGYHGVPRPIKIGCVTKTTITHEMLHLTGLHHEEMYNNMPASVNITTKSSPCLKDSDWGGMSEQPFGNLNNYYNCPLHTGWTVGTTKFQCSTEHKEIECPRQNGISEIDMSLPAWYPRPATKEKVEKKIDYEQETKLIDGKEKVLCYTKEQFALPKPIGCLEKKTNKIYANGEEFLIGENKCRCDFIKEDAKISILNGCDNFKHEEWILGRYAHNYECDKNENKLVHKIVGCTTPLNSNGPKFVLNGEKIESANTTDKYFCSIYENGSRARNEWRE